MNTIDEVEILFTDTLSFRNAVPDDFPFIYDSWRRSASTHLDHAHLGAKPGTRFHATKFNAVFNEVQKKLLSLSNILVATDVEDPDAIVGYLVYQVAEGRTHLHYLHVKKTFWRKGVGRALLSQISIDLNRTDYGVIYTSDSPLFRWYTPPFSYKPFWSLGFMAELINQLKGSEQ